ncbi:MAG: ParB N-terminal domain-containing protein [Chloroflexi bacterium]|nr:ParB N-terminal domain-containing protein [Chloroflexota bacterium]
MYDHHWGPYQQGETAFIKAKRRAMLQNLWARIRRKPIELLTFGKVQARLRLNIQYDRGIQDIPLNQIVGSVGRATEFSKRFLPMRDRTKERWSRVYAQAISPEGLPPIDVYKVDDIYFVIDGNHRVSVAHELGAKTIQAHVIELPTPVKYRPDLTTQEIDLAYYGISTHGGVNR